MKKILCENNLGLMVSQNGERASNICSSNIQIFSKENYLKLFEKSVE